jgi:hypothetical protein
METEIQNCSQHAKSRHRSSWVYILKNKDNLAIVVLLIMTLLITVMIVANNAVHEKSQAGFIELFGYQLNENIITHSHVFKCLYGLTLVTCFVIILLLLRTAIHRNVIFDHVIYIILLIVASSSCLVTFYQYGFLRNKYFDIGDMFHYYLGPKYLAEVGYDNLYICAAIAQQESGRKLPRYMRSLTTNKVASSRKFLSDKTVVDARAKFSGERWEEFKKDVDTFRRWHSERSWQRRFADHGYNGTPGWNYFASFITNNVPINHFNLTLVSMLNMYLVVIMFMIVLKVFGWRLGLLFTILFCINFPDRYLLGGSILRYVWIVSLVIGLSFIKLNKYGWAGMFIALAAMLIIFPILFLLGIVLKCAYYCANNKHIPWKYIQFLRSAAITCIVVFGLSISIGQGLSNWTGFLNQMTLNSSRLANGRIGFIYNFMHPKEIFEKDGQQAYEPRLESYKAARSIFISWENLSTIFIAVIIIYIIKLTGKMDDLSLTVFLGFSLYFLFFSTVRYYYAGLVGLPLMWHSRMDLRSGKVFVFILFLIMAAAYHFSTKTIYCFIYNTLLSVAFTCYIVVVIEYFLSQKVLQRETTLEEL